MFFTSFLHKKKEFNDMFFELNSLGILINKHSEFIKGKIYFPFYKNF